MKISNNKILSAKIKATLKLFFGIPFGLLFALFFAVYLDLNATEEESFRTRRRVKLYKYLVNGVRGLNEFSHAVFI